MPVDAGGGFGVSFDGFEDCLVCNQQAIDKRCPVSLYPRFDMAVGGFPFFRRDGAAGCGAGSGFDTLCRLARRGGDTCTGSGVLSGLGSRATAVLRFRDGCVG